MGKILKKMNGSKKHALPILNIAAIGLVLTMGWKVLGKVEATSAERAEVKAVAVGADLKARKARLYAEQEVSQLEIKKLDKDLFIQYTEHSEKAFDELKEEGRENTRQIIELIKNGH